MKAINENNTEMSIKLKKILNKFELKIPRKLNLVNFDKFNRVSPIRQ